MEPLLVYLLLFSVTLVEGGEFALLFAGFLLRVSGASIGPASAVIFAALIAGDLLWYRYGYVLYQIPILNRAERTFSRLDQRIREHPTMVAIIARFSYGTHRLTIARYRTQGVSLGTMLVASLASVVPWMLVVSLVVVALQSAAAWAGHVFRFAEIILAFGFGLFFFAELRVSAYIRSMFDMLTDVVVDLLVPKRMWTQRFIALYGLALIGLLLLIIVTPLLVRDGISVFPEEAVEMMLLTIISLIGVLVYRAYLARLKQIEERYEHLVRHVGALNLQAVQVDALFNDLIRIPESKRDLRRTLESLNANILAAVAVPWVLTRIIDLSTGRTLTEHLFTRPGATDTPPELGNKLLLSGQRIKGCYAHASDHRNTYVRAVCVVPTSALNDQQHVVIRAAVNSIALLYLVMSSRVLEETKGPSTNNLPVSLPHSRNL